MSLTKIILRLARNPGFPGGDDGQGYVITAPVDKDGKLLEDEWRAARKQCTVIRFKPGVERDADGWLLRRGAKWYFHYDEEHEGDDEPVFRLGDHVLAVGSYVTIHESDGQDLTYRVAEHVPVSNKPAAGAAR